VRSSKYYTFVEASSNCWRCCTIADTFTERCTPLIWFLYLLVVHTVSATFRRLSRSSRHCQSLGLAVSAAHLFDWLRAGKFLYRRTGSFSTYFDFLFLSTLLWSCFSTAKLYCPPARQLSAQTLKLDCGECEAKREAITGKPVGTDALQSRHSNPNPEQGIKRRASTGRKHWQKITSSHSEILSLTPVRCANGW